MSEETLSERIHKKYFKSRESGSKYFWEKDVKEKIQEAERRLKKKLKLYGMKIISNDKSMILREHEKNKIIDKIFKEVFGENLI